MTPVRSNVNISEGCPMCNCAYADTYMYVGVYVHWCPSPVIRGSTCVWLSNRYVWQCVAMHIYMDIPRSYTIVAPCDWLFHSLLTQMLIAGDQSLSSQLHTL